MNKQTEHIKIITELSVCEDKIDIVLLDQNYHDHSLLAGAAGGAAGAAGVGGLAYWRGRKGLKKPMNWDPADIGKTIGRGVSTGAKDIQEAGGSLWESLKKLAAKGGKAIPK